MDLARVSRVSGAEYTSSAKKLVVWWNFKANALTRFLYNVNFLLVAIVDWLQLYTWPSTAMAWFCEWRKIDWQSMALVLYCCEWSTCTLVECVWLTEGRRHSLMPHYICPMYAIFMFLFVLMCLLFWFHNLICMRLRQIKIFVFSRTTTAYRIVSLRNPWMTLARHLLCYNSNNF